MNIKQHFALYDIKSIQQSATIQQIKRGGVGGGGAAPQIWRYVSIFIEKKLSKGKLRLAAITAKGRATINEKLPRKKHFK